jgi:hypothetical protein
VHDLNEEMDMKVKTNVRAGKQNRGGSGGGSDNPPGSEDPVLPPPPISRCVGL